MRLLTHLNLSVLRTLTTGSANHSMKAARRMAFMCSKKDMKCDSMNRVFEMPEQKAGA